MKAINFKKIPLSNSFLVLAWVKKGLLYDDDYSGRRIQSLRL